MNNKNGKGEAQTVDQALGRLLESKSACDKRKAVDLEELLRLSQGQWKGRFAVLGMASGARGSLLVICGLKGTRGLVWTGEAREIDAFQLAVAIPSRYPLSMPQLQFIGKAPFSPHVVHPDFLPDAAGLPPELRGYARQGVGYCCYLEAKQWNAARMSLATAVWQASRIVGGRIHAEKGSLNNSARDYMLRMRKSAQGLDLGPPLSYPTPKPGARSRGGADRGGGAAGSGDMEWVEAGAEARDGA